MSSNGNGRINWAKRKIKEIPIEEYGATVTIRALSSEQLDSLREDDANKTFTLLALSIVNNDLQRIYTTDETMAELKEMSITARKLISDEIGMLNGFSKEAIEEASKKSEPVPSTDSN